MNITINCHCPLCGKTSFVTCTEEQWRAYEEGALAQEAFANLTVCAREAIISGMCGDCQASFFEEEEDDCDEEYDGYCDGECDICYDVNCPYNANYFDPLDEE